jgi:two-component system, OmpR family, sensor histidine kinase VicK
MTYKELQRQGRSGEERSPSKGIRLVQGAEKANELLIELIRGSKTRIHLYCDSAQFAGVFSTSTYVSLLLEKAEEEVDLQLVTEVTSDNLTILNQIMKVLPLDSLRHLDGARGSIFLADESSYASLIHSPKQSGPVVSGLIYSQDKSVVDLNLKIFGTMWNNAVPAEQKLRELEQRSSNRNSTEALSNSEEVYSKLTELVLSASHRMKLVLPTLHVFEAFKRSGVFDAIEDAVVQRNVEARILCPTDQQQEEFLRSKDWKIAESAEYGKDNSTGAPRSSKIVFQTIDVAPSKTRIILLVSDDSEALQIELSEDSADILKSIGPATYSSNRSTVATYVALFEKLWRESELRFAEKRARHDLVEALGREERLRKGAELLQDILAHDIRNYNQVTRLGVEMLQEELGKNDVLDPILTNIIESVDGSTRLLERAKKLGKIVSETNVILEPVNVMEVIESSMSLIRAANPSRKIVEVRKAGVTGYEYLNYNQTYVMADDLLHEVFSNLYSNCVKYSDTTEVHIGTEIKDQALLDANQHLAKSDLDGTTPEAAKIGALHHFIRISISDEGRGIPDDQKDKIFSRYLKGAKGNGLGLSIVGALVLERYGGRIFVRDRVPGDSSKGAVIEVFLQKAEGIPGPSNTR